MDESICLDDDLLTPQTEQVPPTSPLAALDAPILEEEGEDSLAPAMSMENVKLETSPTSESLNLLSEEDNGSGQAVSKPMAIGRPTSQGDEAHVTVETEIADLSTSVPQVEPEPLVDEEQEVPEIGEGVEITLLELDEAASEEVKGDTKVVAKTEGEDASAAESGLAGISSYFSGSPIDGEDQDARTFFDDLPVMTQTSLEAAEVEDQLDSLGKERTTSMGSSSSATEATTVSFEESKGAGMKFVGSMQNVSKFFVEEDVSNDAEGKSFFDTFTAADGEELVPQPDVVSPPVTVASATPPLPSPLHVSLPRSRTTSQSSPLASPRHGAHGKADSGAPLPSSDNPSVVQQAADALSSVQSAFQGGEDPFFASLNMSDMDRRNDAWIPSEMTRQTLVSVVNSPAGTYSPETDQLTMPGIIVEEALGDPVRDLVQKYMGDAEASKRVTPTAGDVPQNEEGLRKLIIYESYRSAIELTGHLLTQVGQGPGKLGAATKHTPYTLQSAKDPWVATYFHHQALSAKDPWVATYFHHQALLWFTRLALQMKLRLYSHAESECQAFGSLDRPDLFYEFYPEAYPGRKGSMVPFEMRVLCAELPQYLNKPQESLDHLHYINGITETILSNLASGLAEDGSMLQLSTESRRVSQELWESRHVRVLYSLANCLLNIKDYQTAVTIFEQLLKKADSNQSALLCGIGRVYLQMGDVKTAEKYFKMAEEGCSEENDKIRCRNLMNKGFIALGYNQFSEAQQFFKEAVDAEPTNAVAVNNMAVCWLYMGRLKEALSTLENLIHTDPARFLQEGLLFNLCTLYELESSRAIHKKQALLDLVSKHKGNGFNTACLKIQ